jgi:hypothetical protein
MPTIAKRWTHCAIKRPALDNQRVQCNAAGQVVLKLKTAWRGGTAHPVMSPLEFMQRLAGPEPLLYPRLGCSSGVPCDRQLFVDQFSAANVSSGSSPTADDGPLLGRPPSTAALRR